MRHGGNNGRDHDEHLTGDDDPRGSAFECQLHHNLTIPWDLLAAAFALLG